MVQNNSVTQNNATGTETNNNNKNSGWWASLSNKDITYWVIVGVIIVAGVIILVSLIIGFVQRSKRKRLENNLSKAKNRVRVSGTSVRK
jgi:hypothetical protein